MAAERNADAGGAVYLSYESIAERIGRKPRVIFLTPQGKTFNQDMAKEFAWKKTWFSSVVIMRELMSAFWKKS